MTHILEVPWDRIRQGNRVAALGRPRRVAIVTRTDSRYVEVIFEDGTRERHLADDRAQVVLGTLDSQANDSEGAGSRLRRQSTTAPVTA